MCCVNVVHCPFDKCLCELDKCELFFASDSDKNICVKVESLRRVLTDNNIYFDLQVAKCNIGNNNTTDNICEAPRNLS